MTPEGAVRNAICEFLAYQRGCLFWVAQTVGIYDQTKKLYRKPGRYHRNGVADILGVYLGIPIAIEVKSAKGVLSEHQRVFLDDFKRAGGIAIVARCVDDVIALFKKLKKDPDYSKQE